MSWGITKGEVIQAWLPPPCHEFDEWQKMTWSRRCFLRPCHELMNNKRWQFFGVRDEGKYSWEIFSRGAAHHREYLRGYHTVVDKADKWIMKFIAVWTASSVHLCPVRRNCWSACFDALIRRKKITTCRKSLLATHFKSIGWSGFVNLENLLRFTICM